MTRGDVGQKLAAPARLIARQWRHVAMRSRRVRKQVMKWDGWHAAAMRAQAIAGRLRAVQLPLHRLASELRQCPACGGGTLRLFEPVSLYRVVERTRIGFATGCEDCGLLFVNPLPDSEALAAFYSPAGTWGLAPGRRTGFLQRQAEHIVPETRRSRHSRTRQALLEAIAPLVPVFNPPAGASVLDFGCGDGKLLNSLLEEGWRTFGIEPSIDVAFSQHQRLEAVPQEPAFDLIMLHHVLEHIPRPLDLLIRLSRAMRDDASMFISVPRVDTLPEHGDFRYCLNGRTHIVAFTEACLRDLLRRAGLETIALLSDKALDDRLSGGKPLRMRVIARKTGRVPPQAGRPLDAARRAMSRYHRLHGGDRSWLERRLPVRVQAYVAARRKRNRVGHSSPHHEHVA